MSDSVEENYKALVASVIQREDLTRLKCKILEAYTNLQTKLGQGFTGLVISLDHDACEDAFKIPDHIVKCVSVVGREIEQDTKGAIRFYARDVRFGTLRAKSSLVIC